MPLPIVGRGRAALAARVRDLDKKILLCGVSEKADSINDKAMATISGLRC